MTRWKHSKPIIGITGGIGSGKSTVARMFAELGCAVIDADELAQAALDDPQVAARLREWWGEGVIGPDGRTDRQAVGKIVFDNPEQLDRLENLIHPRVNAGRQALRRKYLSDPEIRAIVEDCPLLYEAGLDGEVDVAIFVATSRQTRLARVAESRGWTDGDLARREKNQLSLDIKASRADYVIDNDAREQETFSHVRGVLSKIFQGLD